MNLAPIALFVYKRSGHTQKTIEAIRGNALAKESDLFIFSDAPKTPDAAAAVREVRESILGISGFKSITIIERERNYGLAGSIIDGVTRLCNDYGRVIVLEDDIVVSPYFLEYMNAALDRYKNEERVMQISGHMFPVEIRAGADAVFLPMTTSWGWATWQRAWQHFDPSASGYEKLKYDASLRRQFNLDDAYDYFGMLEQQLQGEIDSWAVRWYLNVFMCGGLVLFPRKALVKNTGFDGSGTHCGASRFVEPLLQDFKVNNFPAVAINDEAMRAVYSYLGSRDGLISRMRNRAREWFGI